MDARAARGRATVVLCAVAALAACGRPVRSIPLPETPILSGQEAYALVTVAYARLHVEPDRRAPVGFHARMGDVLSVRSRLPGIDWVEVEDVRGTGWVRRSRIRFFAREAQARNAARGLER